jgi:4-hydroxy-tetrahydrodipicolinate synthase
MNWFKGTGTALATPFNDDFSIDMESFDRLVQEQKNAHMDALVLMGTTGESPVISFEERAKLLQYAKKALAGSMPLIVGTGSNNPSVVLENNRQAEQLGADAILLVNPYYNKSSQDGLVDYYSFIAKETSLPIMLYNVPSRTGMNILPETMVRIHHLAPNVSSIKEASADISQIARLMAIKPESLQVFSGNDDQTLPIMALGGVGVVSVASNVAPVEMRAITNDLLKGDWISGRAKFLELFPFMKDLFIETSPSPLKYALSCRGWCKNVLRRPMIKASENVEKIIHNDLNRLGLL